jgi:hypothetical protein
MTVTIELSPFKITPVSSLCKNTQITGAKYVEIDSELYYEFISSKKRHEKAMIEIKNIYNER